MDPIQPNTAAALAFLLLWAPEGPWTLTGIVPDGAIETRTFMRSDQVAMEKWIDRYQGKRNLYFQVNPPLRPLDNKATKEDIASLRCLHVDLDPRAGEDPEREKARILTQLKGYDPPPTVIIDSGGGYQGFWMLDPGPELAINGEVAKAEELERYNLQLERAFGGDHCHNVDRIMRLPGTVNLPNKRKRAKGRVPVLSHLVEFAEERSYPLSAFTAAVFPTRPLPPSPSSAPPRRPGAPPEAPAREVGVPELQAWASEHGKVLLDHTLALIATGKDPVDPNRYPSRSEALFRVVCDLLRAGVPDDMIYTVITSPSNGISASVLDKKKWGEYAQTQITNAREHVEDPWLRQLNAKHAVIADLGGKCRIISEVWDFALNRTRISKQSFEDFRNRYCHIKVEAGKDKKGVPQFVPLGVFWVGHPMRRQYETLVFAPGREVEGAYNLWRGFAVEPQPGDKHQSYLDHIRDNIAGGREDAYHYIIHWLARAVQHPDCPGETALVLRGRMGTGKGFFAREFGALFGRHFLHVGNSKHIVGQFNAHLRDTVVLFGDEAFYAGDKQHESILKMLITEPTIPVEAKGVDVEQSPNYIHAILASNKDWVVPAGVEERRFYVADVGEGHMQDKRYFRRLSEEMANGGRANLLHFLLRLPLENFEVRDVPATAALQDQKLLSMSPEEQWFLNLLLEGRIGKADAWEQMQPKDALWQNYINDMRDQGRQFRMSKVGLGKFLARTLPPTYPRCVSDYLETSEQDFAGWTIRKRRKVGFYELPALHVARAWWDKHMGGPYDWPREEEPNAKIDTTPAAEKPPF